MRSAPRRNMTRHPAIAAAVVLSAAGLALSLTAGCQRDSQSPSKAVPQSRVGEREQWFRDVTRESGLDFVHDAGPTGTFFMPQIVGSGAALFDFNNDGRLDILLLQNGGPESGSCNRLYRQLPDGRFEDVSAGSGLNYAGYCMGVAVGDVNNDGWPDVLITEYGGVRLFLNNGNGTFRDVSKEAGLNNPAWGASAAFVDYDRDGRLDLVIVNYLDYNPTRRCSNSADKQEYCGPQAFQGSVTRLFHNLGSRADGTVAFEDMTVKAGLAQSPGPGLGVFCADFNGDRWPDIFVANDGARNRLWINQRDGTFKEEAVRRGLAFNNMGQTEANMGVAVADVDGDGALDVLVTHLGEETNRLWRQSRPGLFSDETRRAGVADRQWRATGFGTVLGDFDHDGAADLAVANGKVKHTTYYTGTQPCNPAECLSTFWKPYAERSQLFINDGQGRFRDVSLENPDFCGTGMVSRGLACGDLDGDGALDLLVTNVAGPACLYRNVAPKRGHWLMVRAVDPALKRDAYGAEIRVCAGGRTWLRVINPAYSYLCSNDPRAHFGLGEVGRIDSIQVVWPDGSEESFPGPDLDSFVVLDKGKGQAKQ